MSPIFVAAGPYVFLREGVRPMTLAAIVISLEGVRCSRLATPDWTDRRLLGDGLVLARAVVVGLHMVIGRKARRTVGNLPYITVVYVVAAVALLTESIISGTPMLGLPAETYF